MHTKSQDPDMVKVQFYDKDVGYENLWATMVGDNLYKLESIPYFVYGVSLGDIVHGEPDHDGRIEFVTVVERSGHTTLRARPNTFTLDDEPGKRLIHNLKNLGCLVEILEPRLVAIDIAPELGVELITKFLTSEAIPWEYSNPTLDELRGSDQ